MAKQDETCQFTMLETTGRPLTLVDKAVRRLNGRYQAVRRLAQRVVDAVVPPNPADEETQDIVIPELLDLKPGDWVRVRPPAEIRATLDANNKHRGMYFMPGMERFCGQRLRVAKPIKQIYDENGKTMRKLRPGTVILEGTYCPGTGVIEGCDRSCMYFWREAWLERTDAPAAYVAPAPGESTNGKATGTHERPTQERPILERRV